MTEMGEPAHRKPRLSRVDLPWMQVHDRWLALAVIQMTDGPAGEPVRKQPEVSPSCYRNTAAQQPHRRKRKLDQLEARSEREPVGKTWRVGDPVAVVHDGEDARVVLEAGLGEDLEAPPGLAGHRGRGRLIGDDRPHRDLLHR